MKAEPVQPANWTHDHSLATTHIGRLRDEVVPERMKNGATQILEMRSESSKVRHSASGRGEVLTTPDGETSARMNSAFTFVPRVDSPGGSATDGEKNASRAPFEELDRPINSPGNHCINGDSSRVEAGFEDPAVGWVRVRAHMDADGVHASLIPGSIEAAKALGAHLSGLNAHLASQNLYMHPVTVSLPGHGGSEFSPGGAMQQGQGNSDPSNQREHDFNGFTTSSRTASTDSNGSGIRFTEDRLSPSIAPVAGGVYVSVLA